MDPSRASYFLDPSSAMAAITKHKAEAMKLAREQGAAIKEMCRRGKSEAPSYEFEELIGKGTYGRVYKGHQIPSGKLVAIKVMDIDSMDYKSGRDFKDESIKDFIHETKVMKQVKDAGAKNINQLIEAVSIQSQLWLVCEYCPGGSVRTLMRATGDQLDEKFIIPIARELAVGLCAIHDAGVIHRDIKAANILIHEEGHLEICDFGVAGVLQTQLDKRSTWIGTPHWMPPEMFSTRGLPHKYGSEIDVWAFGCTLFEFATGNPPNSNLHGRMQIGRQLNRTTPKLANEQYSDGLKELVSYALDSDPATRPTMADILAHPYIAGTEEEYPTSSLRELVKNYYHWSQRGGQRISLFHPGGAAAAEIPGEEYSDEDWNFSTTDGFERRFSVLDLDQLAASLAELEQEMTPASPKPSEHAADPAPAEMTSNEKANFDERVRRGATAMEGLFDENKPDYKYETKSDFVPIEPEPEQATDLPLRTVTDRSSVASTLIDIDIGNFDSSHYAAAAATAQPFQLADANTIKANRSSGRRRGSSGAQDNDEEDDFTFQPQTGPRPPTMEWKFPAFIPTPESEPESEPEPAAQESPQVENDTTAKRATMEWTFPSMDATVSANMEPPADTESPVHDTIRPPTTAVRTSIDSTSSAIDLGEPGDARPTTPSVSSQSDQSDSEYDPFRFDRPITPQNLKSPQQDHFYDHPVPSSVLDAATYSSSDSGLLDGPGPDEEDTHPLWQSTSIMEYPPSNQEPFPTGEMDMSSVMSSPAPETFSTARREPDPLPAPRESLGFSRVAPPSIESLTEGADDAVVSSELDRLLGDLLDSLKMTGDALGRANTAGPEKNDAGLVSQNSE